MAGGPNFNIDGLLKEQRLDEIERLWLQNPSVPDIVRHLQARTPLPGCQDCGADAGKTLPTCKHGPFRWRGGSPDKPMGVKNIRAYLKAMQSRLRARVLASPDALEQNRVMAIARYDALWQRSMKDNNVAIALASARSREAIDGTRIAVDRLGQPTLYQRVRALMARVVDYDPPPPDKYRRLEPMDPELARYWLQRLEQDLLAANEAADRFRRLGEPTGMTESQRLQWRRGLLDEMLYLTMTSPNVDPAVKRTTIISAAGTASMITEGVDLVEQHEKMRKRLEQGQD